MTCVLHSSSSPSSSSYWSSSFPFSKHRRNSIRPIIASSETLNSSSKPTKLVTFLGKGGSGKTTSAIFAAQHYAMAGLRTCLIIQTQDPCADYLLHCNIGTTPTLCNPNLWALRLHTTQMLLEPLNQLKQADARLKITQGVLEGVVGEELGVLPAMDSLFGALMLERRIRFSINVTQGKDEANKYDVIVYDGMSSDETLRMVGAASKARLYLKYLRNLAEKTDFGRLASPSLLKLVDETMNLSGTRSLLNEKTSSEIWGILETILERGSFGFSDPCKFGCFLVMDPRNRISVKYAERFWGCTIQAGAVVSGAFGIGDAASIEEMKQKFSPLPFAFIPQVSNDDNPLDWNSIMLNPVANDARLLLANSSDSITPPVKFDEAKKSITLFMPGFEKTEIKLYQYRGGCELLVEAGDQRRVISLPAKIQGVMGEGLLKPRLYSLM
ncbi:P-loop containing nucleoside triphosphate hydrolases superfamily protein [Euphorbia peplus]|nr:P-loop containing nucleoside triphosphate hydrolases superfamily protein [Euphorbia peplus]